MRDIKALHPRLQTKIGQLISLCEKQGLKIQITECVRTKAEQDALYAQGRTKAGKIVTNAKGSSYSSMHQWGISFDFCRADGKGAFNDSDGFFNKVGGIGKSIGLEWGGSWKSPVDKPHFQLPDWGSTPTQLKKLYGTPEKFMTWNPTTNPFKEPILTVKKGSKGNDAKWVQWHLKRLNFYTGNIDGDFGANSDKALRNFQSAKKLAVDGKCGKSTRTALKNS